MKKALCLTAMLLVVMGCEDTTNITGDEAQLMNGRVVAALHGIVADNASGARLNDVLVTTVVNGGVRTNRSIATGYYVFSGLNTGEYELTFSRSGYAMHYATINVPSLDDFGVGNDYTSEDYPISMTRDMDMLPLSSSLTGSVYLRTAQDEEIPAYGVTVQADFSDYSISPRTMSTQTSVNGSFALDSMPAAGPIRVYAMQFSDGESTWTTATATVALYPDYKSSMSNLVMVLED